MKKTIILRNTFIIVGVALVLALSASSAWAGYTVTLLQQGPNVVATGSGTLDITGLNFNYTGSASASMFPSIGVLTTGPAVPNSAMFDNYNGNIGGPVNFGSGGFTNADNGNGDIVGIVGVNGGQILVPHGYVSGALSDSATYNNQTFSSLGVAPGTYEWTWGNGPDQNFTLIAVPEPRVGLLLAAGLLLLVGVRLRQLRPGTHEKNSQ